MTRALVLGVDHVAQVVPVELPSLGPRDVRVIVEAASLSRPAGRPPEVVGSEFVGRVAAVGEDVTGLSEGTTVLGVVRFGACATELVVPVPALSPASTLLTTEQLLVVPVSGLSAVAAMDLADVGPGDLVLVADARGAASCVIAGLCRSRGATAVGTVVDQATADLLGDVGFEHLVVGPPVPDPTVLAAWTAGRPITAVVDCSWATEPDHRSVERALAPGARIVWLRQAYVRTISEDVATVRTAGMMRLNLVQHIARRPEFQDTAFRELVGGFVDQSIHVPFVDMPFERGPEAYDLIRSGTAVGKVIIRM